MLVLVAAVAAERIVAAETDLRVGEDDCHCDNFKDRSYRTIPPRNNASLKFFGGRGSRGKHWLITENAH